MLGAYHEWGTVPAVSWLHKGLLHYRCLQWVIERYCCAHCALTVLLPFSNCGVNRVSGRNGLTSFLAPETPPVLTPAGSPILAMAIGAGGPGLSQSARRVPWATGLVEKPTGSEIWREMYLSWASDKKLSLLLRNTLPSSGCCSIYIKKYLFKSANCDHLDTRWKLLAGRKQRGGPLSGARPPSSTSQSHPHAYKMATVILPAGHC